MEQHFLWHYTCFRVWKKIFWGEKPHMGKIICCLGRVASLEDFSWKLGQHLRRNHPLQGRQIDKYFISIGEKNLVRLLRTCLVAYLICTRLIPVKLYRWNVDRNPGFRVPLNTYKWVHTPCKMESEYPSHHLRLFNMEWNFRLVERYSSSHSKRGYLTLCFQPGEFPNNFSSNRGTQCLGIVTEELCKAFLFTLKFYCPCYSQDSWRTEKANGVLNKKEQSWTRTIWVCQRPPFHRAHFSPTSGSALLWGRDYERLRQSNQS